MCRFKEIDVQLLKASLYRWMKGNPGLRDCFKQKKSWKEIFQKINFDWGSERKYNLCECEHLWTFANISTFCSKILFYILECMIIFEKEDLQKKFGTFLRDRINVQNQQPQKDLHRRPSDADGSHIGAVRCMMYDVWRVNSHNGVIIWCMTSASNHTSELRCSNMHSNKYVQIYAPHFYEFFDALERFT